MLPEKSLIHSILMDIEPALAHQNPTLACINRLIRTRLASTLTAFLLTLGLEPSFANEPIEFNRDIRPILSDACFA